MTNKEMAEIFSVMLLAWPNAEVFKGGIAKLGPTIKLWTACTADVDFWTGQQAVINLCKSCKFPPTIAEFRQQVVKVNEDAQAVIEQTFQEIRNADLMYGSVTEFFEQLPPDNFIRQVITAMGGPDALVITVKQDTHQISMWDTRGLEEACRIAMRGRPSSFSGSSPALASSSGYLGGIMQ